MFAGPGGVIYVTANSASGSKYYDITKPDNSGTSGAGNGADPLNPDNYWYNSVQNQEHVRSYVKVAGAQRQAGRRERPQRHLRGAERGRRARQLRATTPPTASRSARSSTR